MNNQTSDEHARGAQTYSGEPSSDLVKLHQALRAEMSNCRNSVVAAEEPREDPRTARTDRYWGLMEERGSDPMKWVMTYQDLDSALEGTRFAVVANMARDGSGGDAVLLDTMQDRVVALYLDAVQQPEPQGVEHDRLANYVRAELEDYFRT